MSSVVVFSLARDDMFLYGISSYCKTASSLRSPWIAGYLL